MRKVRIGIIGCGNISGIYLKNCTTRFGALEVAAVADLVAERAEARAKEFGVPRACRVDELLADSSIELVVNLTVPKAHAEVSLAALAAGKHVYAEKPLALSIEEGRRVVEAAKELRLRAGAAPDTFLGGGLQTCRKLIDDGWIGKPVAATAFLGNHGHEGWHPDPEFYYKPGGGPLFDMGPYYLTALVSLMGPVKRVSGSARRTFEKRTITSAPRRGEEIRVEVPTHVAGTLEFENGAIATLVTSFDVWGHSVPNLEIYGTDGSLRLPDPNTFGGPVLVKRAGAADWKELPLTHGFAENSRGLGVADLARAVVLGGAHRASVEMTFHVLEIMCRLLDAAAEGRRIELASTCARPLPLATGSPEGDVSEWAL